MIVIDTELSGIDPLKNSLLSIGALDFDNPENQFYGECKVWKDAHIEDEALEVNGFSREQCLDPKKQSDSELLAAFIKWTQTLANHTIAGHNVSFDLNFLQTIARREHMNWPFAHRVVDLHSVAYFDMVKKGIEPPTMKGRSDLNLDKILLYVGILEEPKPHNALMGAKVEAEALSRLFYGKNLLPEFALYPISKI